MNNGDMPASPAPSIPEMVQLKGATEGTMTTEYVTVNGLTKREHIAAMAMQGIMAAISDNTPLPSADIVASHAIEYADELLKQLETKEEG